MKTETEIDLNQFCQTYESLRFAMDKPFVKNGCKYATDARIIIRVPTDEPDTDIGEKKFPNSEHIYAKYEAVVCDQEWPESFPDCPTCGQLGYVTRFECPICDGTGYQECDLGHEHDCDECQGNGWTRGRVGKTDKEIHVTHNGIECDVYIGDERFARELIAKVSALPKPIKWGSCGKGEPMKVTAGDAVLLVMPVDRSR